MFFLRKDIRNLNSFVSRRLYTLMLAIYIRHIWVCSILIILSDDIEKNLEPKPSSCDKFSVCHWNLDSISALLLPYVSTHNFEILCLSETYLDSSGSSNVSNLTMPGYDLYRADHSSNVKLGRVFMYYKHFLPLKVIDSSNIDEVIRSVLNILFFFKIRFHKYKKESKRKDFISNVALKSI